MAKSAVAREAVFALRRQIARIEGTLPEHLGEAVGADATVLRRSGIAVSNGVLLTGVDRLDTALGGGLPKAGLIEIHGAATRDAGAVTGFMLALIGLIRATAEGVTPVLWTGTTEILREAGFPHAGGLQAIFGIEAEALLFCEAKKLTDALWVAEEAARLTTPAAVVLEVRGNPRHLDLTATRRLHARARDSGRLLFLLRQAVVAEPTAAPVRLVVGPASSTLRETIGGPLANSIDRPAFTVTIGKSSSVRFGQFTLEWNPDEHTFKERREQEKRAKGALPVVSLSRYGADIAATPGAVVAFRQNGGEQNPSRQAASRETTRGQSFRPERAADRLSRRAG